MLKRIIRSRTGIVGLALISGAVLGSVFYLLINYYFYYVGREQQIQSDQLILKTAIEGYLNGNVSDLEGMSSFIAQLSKESDTHIVLSELSGDQIANTWQDQNTERLDGSRTIVSSFADILIGSKNYQLRLITGNRPFWALHLSRAWFFWRELHRNPTEYFERKLYLRSIPLYLSALLFFSLSLTTLWRLHSEENRRMDELQRYLERQADLERQIGSEKLTSSYQAKLVKHLEKLQIQQKEKLKQSEIDNQAEVSALNNDLLQTIYELESLKIEGQASREREKYLEEQLVALVESQDRGLNGLVAELDAEKARAKADGIEEGRRVERARFEENKLELENELQKVRQKNSFLSIQLEKLKNEALLQDKATRMPLRNGTPRNVGEAVEWAKTEFSDTLYFGRDVERGIAALSSDAGPPEKIYNYLQALHKLASQVAVGPLGEDRIQWLRNQGIDVSGESDRTLNSNKARQRRTWHGPYGNHVFEMHLKLNKNTSQDQCVRIYYEYDESMKKFVIGWIGRHPKTG